MDLGLRDRVVLVTGASKGIGAGIAAALAAEGARVAISSRSRERIDETAQRIGATGFVWDSSDVDGAPGLLDAVEAALGPVDVLVCNTGGPPSGPDALAFPVSEWEAAHRSLVLAPMALVESAVPGMRERRWGRVLNVVSTTAREPSPVLMLSNSHRAAMLAAFKTIARQVAADGVTVNSVLPGRIDTDRLAQLAGSSEAARAAAEQEVPAGRLGTVEEFAAAAAFLCSAPASYVTGTALPVDGGLLRGI
ncbi:MAG: 3-oxoacyl-[acyl-carrier protein] reductase [Solirubrobacteraceae bacterium]|jgi:3-oxoacyl-[acyl-carrier protein] reductase|nr:3-oxoacyl-[acyl-carrier protein] reductase [Solirubrobacteraceae bacterium]